jgi:hypothetical protein
MSTVSPKGYQDDAVNNALELFRHTESQLQQALDEQSRRTSSAFNGCVLLEAPTGAGKTLMAGLIAEMFSGCEHHYNAKVIWFWFTPFANLVGQAKSALKSFSGLKIRDLSSDRIATKALSGDVFVTTWASVAASNASTRIFRKNGDASVSLDDFIVELREQGFRIGVVIDEAHHTFTKASEAVKFYRDILSPEFSLLITATPNDADVDKFKKAAGIAEIHKIQVSREDAVDVGLIKEAVKSIAYLLPEVPDNQQALIDLELTALADGWRTHEAIKSELAQLKINLTPLMLVQIDSKGKAGEKAVEDTKQRLIGLGIPEEAIAWYTADDPNDELSVVARDESKQVLIFKVAAALGFDAPRAFTLVSLRSTKSTDFGIQVVGRILRVHHKLQTRAANKLLPEILRFGYVFLADIEAQGGLIGAADKINTIKTQLSDITPFTLLVTIAGQTEVQVSHNGQMSLLPSPYIHPVWEEISVIENGNNTIILPSLSGKTIDLWGDFIAPKIGKVEDLKQPYRPLIAGNQYYPLRDIMPVRFKTERIPLGTDDLVKGIVARINLNAEVLNAGRRKSIKVNRLTISIFNQTGTVVEAIQAKLSSSEIIRRSQNALCDGVIDPKDLQRALLARLEKEYNEYQGMELSTVELAQSLNMILALYPALIRNASKSCLAQFKEVYDTAELPKQIEAAEAINRASLNSYGIIPTGLNETERKFAQLLETDTSNTVRWWHRNEDRKPHSVSIVLPNGHRYFPDFIIGVNNRTCGEGILLVEIKGGHILNSDDTLDKITAEHKVYGNPIMLTLDNGKFWMMDYIESTNRIEKGKAFRVENMGQY